MLGRRPWQEELAIIDRTMRAISGITDPEELVNAYWSGIGDLVPVGDFVALSRRGETPPFYLITRGTRFAEDLNPWTQRDRLPRLSGGLLGEIIYANEPVIIDDLPARLSRDDPGWFYLQGYGSLYAVPQYDSGEGLNATCMLVPPGDLIDRTMLPMLHWQSGLFGRGTQNLVLRNRLAEVNAALDRELRVVGELQRSLLPHELPAMPGFDLAASYETSASAGGDYYDFFPLTGGRWGVFIADVAGHGAPAAVMMAITHAIAHTHPDAHTPPAALLERLNAALARSYTRSGSFVTAFYAVLDPAKRTLAYSTAGHNPPRLARGGTVISLDQAGALPLGIIGDQGYTQAAVTLERGDTLLLYTDGITEAMAPQPAGTPLSLFGTERLDRALVETSAAGAEACLARIRADVADFTAKAPANDDRTLIAMRCV